MNHSFACKPVKKILMFFCDPLSIMSSIDIIWIRDRLKIINDALKKIKSCSEECKDLNNLLKMKEKKTYMLFAMRGQPGPRIRGKVSFQ